MTLTQCDFMSTGTTQCPNPPAARVHPPGGKNYASYCEYHLRVLEPLWWRYHRDIRQSKVKGEGT